MEADRILLRGLRVMAYCGVLAEEQARRQPFEINADVVADLSAAGRSDDLGDTIDYGALTDRVVGLVESVAGKQLELNNLDRDIQTAHRRGERPVVLMPIGVAS